MKTHQRFEWALPDDGIIGGDTQDEVYAQLCPGKRKPKDLPGWFLQQQEQGAGSWKWYDSLIGERWRFTPSLNDLVRRIGSGRGRRKNPEKLREQALKNLEKSHEKRRDDHAKAVEIARKGQAGLQAKQTRQDVMDRMERMRAARAAKMAARTPEERAEVGRRISEAKKASNAAKKSTPKE